MNYPSTKQLFRDFYIPRYTRYFKTKRQIECECGCGECFYYDPDQPKKRFLNPKHKNRKTPFDMKNPQK